jgi:hypothetical protein
MQERFHMFVCTFSRLTIAHERRRYFFAYYSFAFYYQLQHGCSISRFFDQLYSMAGTHTKEFGGFAAVASPCLSYYVPEYHNAHESFIVYEACICNFSLQLRLSYFKEVSECQPPAVVVWG